VGDAAGTALPGRVPTIARPSRFAMLRHPTYRNLFVTGTLIFLAMQAQQIARGWLARELTGTNTGLGGVWLAFGIPMLLCAPAAGVVVDRFPKRTVLMWAQAIIATAAAFMFVADAFDFIEYWMLLGASVVHGAGMSVLGPARMSFTGEIVERHELSSSVLLMQMSMNSTRVIGPSIAGALIAIKVVGTAGVYLITTLLCVIALIWSRRLPHNVSNKALRMSPRLEFVEGLRYARSQSQLFVLIVASTLIFLIGSPYIAFLPTLASGVFDVGATGYGLMSTMGAVGALAASFWVAGRVNSQSVWRTQTVCGVALAVGLVLLAAAPTFLIALAVIPIAGGALSGFQATNSSLVLTTAKPEYHGRMQSLMMLGWSGGAMASLPLGLLADEIGLRSTLAAMGGGCFLVMLAVRRTRSRGAALAVT
jgi:MFS family permease